MKKLDASSKKLILGTTLLSFVILTIPVFKSSWLARKANSNQIWKVSKNAFNFSNRSNIVCLDKSSEVLTFDGFGLSRFNLLNGNEESTWSPKGIKYGTWALTPDGANLVNIESKLKGKDQIVLRDTSTQAIKKRIDVQSDSSRSLASIHLITSRHVVLSQSGEVERSGGQGYVVDLQTGKTIPLSNSILYEGSMAFASSTGNELFFGWLNNDNLHLETLGGKKTELSLDERDSTKQPKRQDWDYSVPTLLFDRTQNTVFASIQYTGWALVADQNRTGSVCAWNWHSGSLLWRWQETDVQPVTLALSPDQRLLAVGSTVPIAGTYKRGVRLVVLDALTGILKQEFHRNRGGSEDWQQLVEKVKRTPDEFFTNGSSTPTITGLSWTANNASLVVSYADGELIRWRVH